MEEGKKNLGQKILYRGGTGEIVEKKSRFIANVTPVQSEEEALAFVAAIKKKYWDARHNCYAFVAGDRHQLQRCSDDGEPQGTAGRPMLDVLLREDVHNAAVVVTRYFGGTLLGTGGLVRAYQKATQEGLCASTVVWKQPGEVWTIHTDYNGIGKTQYLLAQNQIAVMDTVYADTVSVQVMVPVSEKKHLMDEITEGTNGAARFEQGIQAEFAVIDGEVKKF